MSETLQPVARWQMHRAKLFSFWYYPDQEFLFTDGCGVLRGHNGSGKSVTTQSLITVLLDGDVRSHKLDPFGGRERNITDTVLGEEGLLGINERIGYILLEFKKEGQEVYKTIGMGIDARRGKAQNKVWYFIVDNKRFGNSEGFLKLYKEEMMEGSLKKIPLNENELRNLIENEYRCGKIFTNRKDYADKVNKHLFGFDTVESFMGLIDLLIQIRSPKLSDKNRPEGVAEVINDSLPQLTEAELRPLTDSIESIDRIEKDLKDTNRDLKAMKRLSDVFITYNQVTLVEKATEYRKATQALSRLKDEIAQKESEMAEKNQQLTDMDAKRRKLKNQSDVKKEELNSLGVKDIEEVEARKQEAETDLADWKKEIESLNRKLEDTITKKLAAQKKKDELEAAFYQYEREFQGFIQEMDQIAVEMDFSKHQQYMTHLVANKENQSYSFHAWKNEARKYGDFLMKIKQELEAYEKKRAELTRIDNDLGDVQMKIDGEQATIQAAKEKIEAAVINVVEAIQYWADHATHLQVDEQTRDTLIEKVDDVFDRLTEEDYLKPLRQLYQIRKEENQHQQVALTHEIKVLQEKITALQTEMADWKNKDEIEPAFVEKKKKEWDALSEAGIAFTPFYEAFEFHSSIDEKAAFHYQNALAESGILSAVIVQPEDVAHAKKLATVLEYGEKQPSNLTQALTASEHPHLEDVLTSISVEETDGTYILANGAFRSGQLTGKASQLEDFIVIGKAARERIRQEKIRQLTAELQQLQEEADDKKAQLEWAKQKAEYTEAEYMDFPSLESIAAPYTEMRRSEEKIQEIYEPQRERLSQAYSETEEESKRILAQLKAKMDFSSLDLSIEAFDNEMQYQRDYVQALNDLEMAFTNKTNVRVNLEDYKERCAEYEEQEDDTRADLLDGNSKKEKAEERIKAYENRLKEMGSEDIRRRITELTQEIDVRIPNEMESLLTEETNTKRDLETAKDFITANKEHEIPFRTVVQEAWEKEFNEHYKLGYIELDSDETELAAVAKEIEAQHGSMIDKKREEIQKVTSRLNKVFNDQNIELFHFDLALQTKQSDYMPAYDTEDDAKNVALNLMQGQMERIVVTVNIEGERVPPRYAVKHLTERLERLNRDVNEKDRDLYERILVNTLGDTIRKKINYVQRWEKEMNKFMEHENLIKFRLAWKPKKRENEEQLDTLKLVEALKRDSQWIDVNEISSHFRSKIKIARRRYERQEQKEQNLKEIMRDELDYRKWFEFEIYFTKKHDKEKKLTRNTYGELSGGQRVLAMVTPVLAALYAKYSEASEECPRLFTLDEAFSRVDEDNINIMFAYIRKLNFNYILNSQSLWGCYASVPSLNIYELSRPENRPYVLIESYYWNGHQKVRTDELEQEEVFLGST
ncbi:TIGR02680 family protein [Oceanobacillus locisalsi]|uniref:TIGR02680 family protein n=1 Tax=Oceanobacillus locisalsi TaxID=546107 RepID=A0ABW3NEI7_9BACI